MDVYLFLYLFIATETSGDILFFDCDDLKNIKEQIIPIGKELDYEIKIRVNNHDEMVNLPFDNIIEYGVMYIYIYIYLLFIYI